MQFRSDRLKQAREDLREHGRKVSQDRFASLVGVSKRSPQRWENDEAEPRMAQLARIAEVTGRPIGFFFGETSTPDPLDEAKARIEDAVGKISDGLGSIADVVSTLNAQAAAAAMKAKELA